MRTLFILLLTQVMGSFAYLPTVLVHGIASDIDEMSDVESWLQRHGVSKTYRIEIGNGVENSINLPMKFQLALFCDAIHNKTELKDGFNMIGLSQGGLIARGYVEECNWYPVRNLITWGTPHQGVSGFSFFNNIDFPNIYSAEDQAKYSFAGYWKDPNRYDEYLHYATYLPELNNEIFHGSIERYQRNIESLSNFVMVWSPIDGVIRPVESCKFEFLTDFLQSDQYVYNLIGLKTLYDSNRLFFHQVNCLHMQFKSKCLDKLFNFTLPYLMA